MHDHRGWDRDFNSAYLWPLLGIAAIAVLWMLAGARLTSERNSVRIEAFQHALSTSKSYAEQLKQNVNLVQPDHA